MPEFTNVFKSVRLIPALFLVVLFGLLVLSVDDLDSDWKEIMGLLLMAAVAASLVGWAFESIAFLVQEKNERDLWKATARRALTLEEMEQAEAQVKAAKPSLWPRVILLIAAALAYTAIAIIVCGGVYMKIFKPTTKGGGAGHGTNTGTTDASAQRSGP